jgi:hypothetical protein
MATIDAIYTQAKARGMERATIHTAKLRPTFASTKARAPWPRVFYAGAVNCIYQVNDILLL